MAMMNSYQCPTRPESIDRSAASARKVLPEKSLTSSSDMENVHSRERTSTDMLHLCSLPTHCRGLQELLRDLAPCHIRPCRLVGNELLARRLADHDVLGQREPAAVIGSTEKMALSDEKKESAIVLKAALAYYASLGLTVARVMTDNGSCYISKAFAKACRQLGLKHIRTKPYTPRTNGKAERFIQTALREWAYAFAYPQPLEPPNC
jgi:hypothetical protein